MADTEGYTDGKGVAQPLGGSRYSDAGEDPENTYRHPKVRWEWLGWTLLQDRDTKLARATFKLPGKLYFIKPVSLGAVGGRQGHSPDGPQEDWLHREIWHDHSVVARVPEP